MFTLRRLIAGGSEKAGGLELPSGSNWRGVGINRGVGFGLTNFAWKLLKRKARGPIELSLNPEFQPINECTSEISHKERQK